jgi:hypothetical protein
VAIPGAIKRAQHASLAGWERLGQAGVSLGGPFNATAFIFQMKNRFREDYNDNQWGRIKGRKQKK